MSYLQSMHRTPFRKIFLSNNILCIENYLSNLLELYGYPRSLMCLTYIYFITFKTTELNRETNKGFVDNTFSLSIDLYLIIFKPYR